MDGNADIVRRRASLPLLSLAFVVAFGVLLLVPIWASLGALEASGHDDHHAGGSASHADFLAQIEAQADAYGLPDGSISPPEGETVYVQALQFGFVPSTIHLKRGADYTLAFHATDVMHGASLIMDGSLNTVLMAGTTVQVPFRAMQSGEVQLRCTEYCGLAHHLMMGRLLIEEY